MKAPKTNYTADQAQDDAQQELRRIVRTLHESPFVNGELIRGVPSSNGDGSVTDGIACTATAPVTLPHGLKRRALGFFEVTPAHLNTGDPCNLVSEPTATTDLTREIRFVPSNSGTCWVWVF